MVTRTTDKPPATSMLAMVARARLAREARAGSDKLAAARQDYTTIRIAELIERELAKSPELRAEQVRALGKIIRGADASTVLARALATA